MIAMNRIVIVSLFLLFLRAGVWGQGGYWEEVNGPYGGGYALLPTDGNTLYARHTDGSLYRSTDNGETWNPIQVNRANVSSYSEEVYIGYSGVFYCIVVSIINIDMKRELYRSTDAGLSWALVNADLMVNSVAETRSGTLLGNDDLNRLHRSTDNGATWVMTPLVNYSPVTCAPLEQSAIILDGASGRLAISADDGENWVERTKASAESYLLYVSSGTLFTVPQFGGNNILYRSADQGMTWQPCPISLTIDENTRPQPIVDLTNGRLLLATNRDLYFSDDDGETWAIFQGFPEQPQEFVWGFPLANGDVWGSRRGAFFRSSDAGATWSFASVGIQQAFIRQLAFISETSALTSTPNGLWRTDDVGQHWTRILADTSASYSYFRHPIEVLGADTFLFGMGGQVWLSTNNGQFFETITPPGGVINSNVFAGANAVLFCSGTSGIMRSEDLGQTWTNIFFPDASLIQLAQHPGGRLFAIVAEKGTAWPNDLFQSTNDGQTWTPVLTLNFPYPQQLAIDVGPNGEIYVLGYNNGSKLAISNNEGVGWQYKTIPSNVAASILGVNEIGIIFTYNHQEKQVQVSADGGNSWYGLPKYEEDATPVTLSDLELSPAGNLYLALEAGKIYRTVMPVNQGAYITGHVRRDADAECSTPDAQEPLRNWAVTLEGENTFYNTTGTDGHYTFFVDTGLYTVQVTTPQSLWWGLCDSVQTVQSDSLFSTDTVDFAAIALAECPLISVSVGVPRLRRCFDNNAYVQYCNPGTETTDSARVDVILDEFLEFVSADLPHEALGNNTYRFQLGSVASGECGQFGLVVHVDCDSTVLGQTHCITAHAYPDTLCTPVPNWSGATVVAEAECQDTVVALRLRNIGPVQSQSLNYIIIEDDVVLMQGQDDYIPGEQLTLERPANGHTWRIESQQEPGHPFSTVAVAFSEGCGGFESLGFVNQFGVNTFEYSWDRVCLENIGAYDPNDKQGLPLGYGEQHRIRPGQELDYLIRFQNTGTDTAFNVFIRDTLSPWLDPASVRPGAASHPYTWTLSGGGVLQFTFANILLPDSNVNLAGSQGFVRFRVAQRPDVPIGAQIFNEAGIYFDFNDPIITNQTLHTVGIDYITGTEALDGEKRPARVSVSPNPALDEVVFQLRDGVFNRHRIVLTDALGRVLRDETATGARHLLRRKGLPAGVCFFRVEDAGGRWVGAGKVQWR